MFGLFTSPAGQTGRQRQCSQPFRSSVTKLVNAVLTTTELTLMHIGISGPPGKGMKQSTLGVRRSKVKVTRGQRQVWRSGRSIILDFLR